MAWVIAIGIAAVVAGIILTEASRPEIQMSQFSVDNVPVAPPPFFQPLAAVPLAAKWPTAIGLVSLIVGIGYFAGIMTGSLSLYNLYDRVANDPSSYLRGYFVSSTASMTSSFISAVLLLIAGILLLRRSPLARAFHYVYAITSLLAGLAIIGIEVFLTMHGSSVGSMVSGVSRLTQAYPIFCLIWFSRADVRFDFQQMSGRDFET
jgi:hypothetical protein